MWDTIVVGAGATGLMTAITAARQGLKVLLLDGKEKIGAKILMSGGTRCNLTNQRVTEKDFESKNKRVVRDVLATFPSARAIEFFKDLGVEVVLEEGGKFFPSSHSGRTVLEALMKGSREAGVQLEPSRKATQVSFSRHPDPASGGRRISKDEAFAESVLSPRSAQNDKEELRMPGGLFRVFGKDFSYFSKTVVLTTGGLSYPATGSDGVGYAIAKSFGHRLVPTTPALTPLTTDDADWKSLSGVSLPVRLTLFLRAPDKEVLLGGLSQKKRISYEESFLFTHFGFSGPAALNISRHWIRRDPHAQVKLAANFLPEANEESFRQVLTRESELNPGRLLKSVLSEKLPSRFVEVLLKKMGIADSTVMNQLKRRDREALLNAIFHFPLSVTGAIGYQKAEVTAGGVDLAEVNRKTLESKLQPGLFFAGEILDVDGKIGGFNFQWSWASGFVAAHGLSQFLGK